MDTGIVAKLWNIMGDTKAKKAESHIGDSIEYILNEEKVDVILNSLDTHTAAQLDRECKYIDNDIKTLSGALVGTHKLISSDIKEATKEMMEVKKFFEKEDGRAALHGVISLPEYESNPENAVKLINLCRKMIEEIFPENQAIYAAHTNTENMHIHFIVNSVGLNGKKIHQNDKFVTNVLQPCINRLAEEYGLTPNAAWGKGQKQKYDYVENKKLLRKLIDRAIEESDNMDEFIEKLQKEDVAVNVGKYISLKTHEMGKAIRTQHLGPNYTVEAIVDRIATKKEVMQLGDITNVTLGKRPDDVIEQMQLVKMKKYKSMSESEKQKVLKLLKLGKNPWREKANFNWQLNHMTYEINANHRAQEYINYYAKDGNVLTALDTIIEAKKTIANDKRIIKAQIRKYKPIIDIYKEMQEIEQKAFLYEYHDVTEYRLEFERYKELTRRLKDNYGKDIYEVAAFLEECDNRFLYASAQLAELSTEYKELKKYARKNQIKTNDNSIEDILNLEYDKSAETMSLFQSDILYLVSESSGVIMNVTKKVIVNDYGKLVQGYDVEILNNKGEVIESMQDMDVKEFSSKLKGMEKKYQLGNPRSFESLSAAKNHIQSIGLDTLDYQIEAEQLEGKQDMQTFSFTQAVNQGYSRKSEQSYVIANAKNPSYMAKVITKQHEIMITVFDRNQMVMESFHIPGVKDTTNSGFKTLMDIQGRYKFSEEIVLYDTETEAMQSISENEKKQGVRGKN